ncbi:hypothetical protein HNQ34_003150 [Anoxybacillus tepidamans]|uniref:HIRAN domain-containing protein n=1 Tax=Anoxybacteroides tepidamans TaxID=265948 RepID=A0A7W8IUI0_9BACL|nr:HIRAN domain-containing protein [Anoxybacillus tepidamans]MBB5326032.1 hypothetical protein [Anoxybacillus tepidamans]
MIRPFVLWLIWQNERTRQRYHVGNLVHHEGKYMFYYEKHAQRRGVIEALKNGYRLHLAFPDIDKIYVSDRLFGPFERRLPDCRRPDFQEILKAHGLSNDYTDMDLLRATGGRLATDPYEFVAPIYVYGNEFDFDFYIAGWRYYEGERVIDQLQVGDDVKFQREPKNEQDPKAVVVLTKQGEKLGYIPAFYSEFMFRLIEEGGGVYKANIQFIHPKANPQLKVNICVCGTLTPKMKQVQQDMLHDLELVIT